MKRIAQRPDNWHPTLHGACAAAEVEQGIADEVRIVRITVEDVPLLAKRRKR